MLTKELRYPCIQIDHVNSSDLIQRTDLSQIILNIRGKVCCISGEKNSFLILQPCCQMLCPVHCNNGFSGSCSAKYSCRTRIVFIHNFSLRWMKEHSPLLQRLSHDTTKFFFPFNHNKGLQRQRAFQSICQIFRRFAALFLFFEKLNYLINGNAFYYPGQCLECITGKAGFFSIEFLCISDGSHERNLFFRNPQFNQPLIRKFRK